MSTLRAKQSFTAWVRGVDGSVQALPVAEGELMDAGHPVVRGREHLFSKVEDYVLDPGRKRTSRSRDDKPAPSEVLMERATKEPGERRNLPTPKPDKVEPKPAEKPVEKPVSKVQTRPGSLPKGKQDGEV